jgi:hypothetical protein
MRGKEQRYTVLTATTKINLEHTHGEYGMIVLLLELYYS